MRKSAWLLLTLCLAGLAILVWQGWDYRQRELARRPQLDVAFEHIHHQPVACAECHHNWVDGTGSGTCYLCHKSDPAINRQMEEMFHSLCRSCHVRTRGEGDESGPLRECSLCHRPDPGY